MGAPVAEAARVARAGARVAGATAAVRPVAGVSVVTVTPRARTVPSVTTTPRARTVRSATTTRAARAVPDVPVTVTGAVPSASANRAARVVLDVPVTATGAVPAATPTPTRVGGGVRHPAAATGTRAVATNAPRVAVDMRARATSDVRRGTGHSLGPATMTDVPAPADRRPVVAPVPTRASVVAPAASVAKTAGGATRPGRTGSARAPVAQSVGVNGTAVRVRAATAAAAAGRIARTSSAGIAVPISEVAGPAQRDARREILGVTGRAVTTVGANGVRSSASRCTPGSSRVRTSRRRPPRSTWTCCPVA